MNIDEPTLDALSKLLDKYHLSELTYQTGDQKITLKKEAPAPVTPAVSAPAPHAAPPVRAPHLEASGATIDAPTVGVFYTAKSPQDPPFVSVGDTVKVGQVVGVIEAMKAFTDVVADVEGMVAAILVNNEEGVEYGQPLIQIK